MESVEILYWHGFNGVGAKKRDATLMRDFIKGHYYRVYYLYRSNEYNDALAWSRVVVSPRITFTSINVSAVPKDVQAMHLLMLY